MRARITPAALVLGLLLTGSVLSAQQPTLVLPGTSFSVLENYLEALRQQAAIPGMSALVAKDDEVVWEKGFGFQNIAARIRPTSDTPYMVGDMSGTLAAVLLLQCVEQRRLQMDDPIVRYGSPALEGSATLRTVLSHAAPPDAGRPFAYSPERFNELTKVMEWCAPQPYRKSVAHRVLNALTMFDSVPGTDLVDPNLPLPDGLFADGDIARYHDLLARIAVPYRVDAKGRADRADLPVATMSASGGLVSTARDLQKLDRELDRDTLLLPETRQTAWTPATARDGSVLPMGLGWFVQSYHGERVVWHFGQVTGAYSSLIIKLPDRGITFILLANSDGLSAPFDLPSGDVTKSLFAQVFLRFVYR